MKKLAAILGIFLLFSGAAQAKSHKHESPKPTTMRVENGVASYYTTSEQGYRTASGIRLDDRALTAAHKTLPFGTMVKVTNVKTNQCVVVKITDRGPYVHGRPIDLSRAAFSRIASLNQGLARVKVETVPNIERSNVELAKLLSAYASKAQLAYISFCQKPSLVSMRMVHPCEFD
jgi:rare lipoprotein A